MRLLPGVEIVDARLGLFLKQHKALVIADLHIGYEAALQKQGIFIPQSQYPKIKQEVEQMMDVCKPKLLIINGDVKHEFGEATRQEWRETLDFLDFLLAQELRIIVVRGNHDNFLIPILRKKGVELFEQLLLKPYLFVHGHKELNLGMLSNAKYIISAHEHPAIVVRDELGVKRKFKCFLVGRVWERDLVVIPSLSPLMEGSAVNVIAKSQLLSPILRVSELSSFDAYVAEQRVYKFPLRLL
jgi:hypothetical protein